MRFVTLLALLALVAAPALAQPTVDGDLTDVDYQTAATKQNSNSGFGPNIDIQSIRTFGDNANSVFYLAVEGQLDTGNNNGFAIWIGVNGTGSPSGATAGTPLGFDGAGHYMGGGGDGGRDDFAADFEVDYMLAVNPGGGSTAIFVDAASVTNGTNTAQYLGSTDQSGTAATNIGSGVFSTGSVTFAFNNGGAANQGYEMAIPYSELGLSDVDNTVSLFAIVVSADGFFSNVSVPGDLPPTFSPAEPSRYNAGVNPNFNANPNGPFNAQAPGALPVELTAFSALTDERSVRLSWETASETNNAGFGVEHRVPEGTWVEAGFVPGAGTSDAPRAYGFTVSDLAAGTYRLRLRQVDFDGTATYSGEVEATIGLDGAFALTAPYPNPARGTATLSLAAEQGQTVTVGVYDALGRRVATAYEGSLQSGQSALVTVETDALPAGVYLVRATGETFAATQRLVVAR